MTPKDTPFSVAELERILRKYDSDISRLPERLSQIVGTNGSRLLTTDSWDLPVPSATLTPELRNKATMIAAMLPDGSLKNRLESGSGLTVVDLFAIRLLDNNVAIADLSDAIRQLLSPRIRMGLKLDVNRPFGNGFDDDNNGIVDDPDEGLNTAERLWSSVFGAASVAGGTDIHFTPFDANDDGSITGADLVLQRQLFARHLYVLAMALTDSGFRHPTDQSDGAQQPLTPEQTARVIAQWAINVADFRDPDAIMTPFEYDVHPFRIDDITGTQKISWEVDGWIGDAPGPDGIPRNGDDVASPDDGDAWRRVVWGCERPELLISETVAWHDRRTEDRNDAGPGDKKTTDTPAESDGINDFDQRLLPRAHSL